MSANNTIPVTYPYPNATDYYGSLSDSWQAKIFNGNDSGYHPFLTFGDITSLLFADSSIYNPYFGLYEQSCWDGDIQNCTSVCQNATLLFANISAPAEPGKEPEHELDTRVPYNILSCMFYPVLSELLGKHKGNESWSQLQQIGDKYNIIPNAPSDLIQTMVDVQVDCYSSYCYSQNEEFCVNFDLDTGNYQALDAPGVIPLFPDWSTITSDSSMNINSDIGGIGVSIAYIIEFGLIMFIWLALRIPRLIQLFKTTTRGHDKGSKLSPSSPRAPGYRENLRHAIHRHSAKMQADATELLTQFHQAQCWFFIPLNLTILLGLGGSTSIFGTSSLGQLVRNMAYVECVTQGGIVFAVATMYFLLFEAHLCDNAFQNKSQEGTEPMQEPLLNATHRRRHGINDPKQMLVSWSLTFISVSLGTAAWLFSFRISKPAKLIDATVGSSKLYWTEYCGSISPATYNGELWTGGNWTHKPSIEKRLPILVINWIILVGMFIFFFRRRIASLCLTTRSSKKQSNGFSKVTTPHWVKQTILCLVEIGVLTFLGFFLNDYITLMRPDLPQIDKTFTMGQLLATFVWATTIVSAYYLIWDWIALLSRSLWSELDTTEQYQKTDDDGNYKMTTIQTRELI